MKLSLDGAVTVGFHDRRSEESESICLFDISASSLTRRKGRTTGTIHLKDNVKSVMISLFERISRRDQRTDCELRLNQEFKDGLNENDLPSVVEAA